MIRHNIRFCWKTLCLSFESLGTNGATFEIIGDFPFVLSLVEAFPGFFSRITFFPASPLSAIRCRHESRDETIRAAYETGAYSYQQIGKRYRVHITTVGTLSGMQRDARASPV
jgi:hypothetical protein